MTSKPLPLIQPSLLLTLAFVLQFNLGNAIICHHDVWADSCEECPGKVGYCGWDCIWKVESGGTFCRRDSCVSGDLVLHTIRKDDALAAEQQVTVENLREGDKVQGLDSNKQSAWCTVEAVGLFSESGWMYGNYTSDHFVMSSDGSVGQHGEVGERRKGKLYNLITSCPLVMDEVGTAFTAVDRFCGTGEEEMAWADYVLLHGAMLKLVQASGSYWFSASTYNHGGNFASSNSTFHNSMHELCFTMLSCAKDENECDAFESAAEFFLNEYVEETAQKKAKASFPALGARGAPGSVSHTVRNASVTPAVIAAYVTAALMFAASVAGVIWHLLRRRQSATTSGAVAVVSDKEGSGNGPQKGAPTEVACSVP